jgi:thiamine-monophosphate kinase
MTPASLGPGREFDLIRRFLAGAGESSGLPDSVRLGPGDDCAILRVQDLAVSNDISVEGVHFRRDWLGAEEIGYRAAAAALSDLAAMAATPVGVLAALAVHPRDAGDVAAALVNGVRAAAEGVRAVLLGGDTSRSPGPLILDVVVLGTASKPVLRRGARPGDALFVTGDLGGAAAAVRAWRRGDRPDPAARIAFVRPRPRIEEARWLADRDALHALIDLSDGLAGDAGHLAAASGVRIDLDSASIPVHRAAREIATNADDALRLALGGGEDYELCFAAEPATVEPLIDEFTGRFGLRLTRVGTVSEGTGVALDGMISAAAAAGGIGFDHFRETDE